MKLLVGLVLLVAACNSSVVENPTIVESQTCGPAARMVLDVCVELGGDDGCIDVDDVCIALCDGVTSCTTVDSELRVLDPWPVAPDGYCVVCNDL